jgi:hypothetical protein
MEGLVISECVCRQSKTEVLMGKVNEVIRKAVGWAKKWNFAIVILMSAFHIGLAYIHVRESGRVNLNPSLAA